jgi:hypothetical protein
MSTDRPARPRRVAVYLKARERNDPASILVAVRCALLQHGIGPQNESGQNQSDCTQSVADTTRVLSDDELAKKARELIQGTLAAAAAKAAAPRDLKSCVAEITTRRAEAREFVVRWLNGDSRIVVLAVDLAAKFRSSSSDSVSKRKSD